MDTPMHGKRAAIKINRQRYKCLDCGRTFQQQLPDMDVKRHMTRRLLDYIQRRSLERTFTEVAQDVGLDEKTVRNIFTDFIRELNARYQPVTPSWLGIDELFLVRKPRCILTNIREKTVVDILADRNKPTI
jgi:transposase